jgi:hypothetical protein
MVVAAARRRSTARMSACESFVDRDLTVVKGESAAELLGYVDLMPGLGDLPVRKDVDADPGSAERLVGGSSPFVATGWVIVAVHRVATRSPSAIMSSMTYSILLTALRVPL